MTVVVGVVLVACALGWASLLGRYLRTRSLPLEHIGPHDVVEVTGRWVEPDDLTDEAMRAVVDQAYPDREAS